MSNTHFHAIPTAPGHHVLQGASCRLLGFEKLVLLPGQAHSGQVAGDREQMLVVLSGTAEAVEVAGGPRFANVGGRANVFVGNPHSVYLPRGSRFTVTAGSRIEAVLVSAPSSLDTEAYEVRPEAVRTGTWGTLNYTRHFREILTQPDGRPASSLIVGETITPSGNWSTFPPHKHEREDEKGGEVFHEEMYYFRVASPEGFGLARHFSPEHGFDHTHTVRDDSLLSIPYGYHTYAAAPGAKSYYLWFLAGDGRRQGVALQPELAWTQKLVGMC